MTERQIEQQVKGQATSDGAGVKLTRLLTQDLQRRLDPFLMLDFFGSERGQDYIGGFPDHPHRGFETVTYMLAGRMRHNDSVGNVGLLHPGSVQWMTAGRGVIHSEMPEQEDGLMNGFQLWLNLPAKDKMCEPWYRDIANEELPEWRNDTITVRLIAGEYQGIQGLVERADTQPLYWDVHNTSDNAQIFDALIPQGHRAFLVLYAGGASIQNVALKPEHLVILKDEGDELRITLQAHSRLIVVAGRPLNEPIAQYGPFVMNTRDELMQAVTDYQNGQLA